MRIASVLVSLIAIAAANPGPPPVEWPEVTLTPLPLSAAAGPEWTVPLDGKWKFQAQAPTDIASLSATSIAAWESIEVPGQWRNQGHDLPAGQTVAYATTFERPAGWGGRVAKLRFDGVFSECKVYLNGREIGSHLGGFTPFECDLTKVINDRGNLLVLSVTSDSLADRMASATKYACHQLGGISRSVTLFAVPTTHISDVIVRTDFDSAYQDATLEVTLEIDSSHASGNGSELVGFQLFNPSVGLVALPDSQSKVEWARPGRTRKTFTFPISSPLWWTPETPHTYLLDVNCAGHFVRQTIGFREIEVKGTRVLVNGRPVKLRGVNRHETDPLRGRSLAPGQWRKDAELFRDANINLIRTCHYPPDHQLVEAADDLGIWVEMESPFCWESGSNDPSHRDAALRQVAEMIRRDRNNPSVLYWSLGNESTWGPNFELASRMVRELDPTRPQTFEWTHNSITETDAAYCEIGVVHYPGFNGPVMAREKSKRPLFMGEYCHLNAYNRRELMTDPGLRDRWGLYLHRLWEQMDAEPNILGGAIWSGIDDTFFPAPDVTLGYGAWGPLDGWRRPKPEYWHVKKTYSPVRVDESKALTLTGGSLAIPVENRSDFINLSKIEARWKIGDQSGTVHADIPSRERGTLVITPAHAPAPGEVLELAFNDPRGFETNRCILALAGPAPAAAAPANRDGPQLVTTDGYYQIKAGAAEWSVNRMTGALSMRCGPTPVIRSGPHLLLIAHNGEGETQMTGKTTIHAAFSPVCSQWQLQQVVAGVPAAGQIMVTIRGTYAEAGGAYNLLFSATGLEFGYDFKVKGNINPRQTGVAFDFAPGFDLLTWKRRGLWSAYPDDHIGRLAGQAHAVTPDGKPAIEIGPRENPGTSPWANDNTRYGSNDFRSTKENVLTASLGRAVDRASCADFSGGQDARATEEGGPGILPGIQGGGQDARATVDRASRPGPAFTITSDGTQSVRAWLDPSTRQAWLLIANYTNGGSERFLDGLVEPDKRPLKPGDAVASSFHILIP
jgi:beta-galactosidase